MPVDEEELRSQMLEFISETQGDFVRSRLEIEREGKHIGFVCAYLFDDSLHQILNITKKHCAMGIEICEPAFWGKGLGAQALTAAIKYYMDKNFAEFYLETWSGNERMLKCAERLGFYICDRKAAFRQVNGKDYDAVTMCLDNKKFMTFFEKAFS